MCFELTVSLMRCLEMVITAAPEVVTDESRPNSDLLLNRICQLISQVLSRVTVPPGIHPLEFYIMEELLPDTMAWTEGIDGPKDKYLNVVEKVRKVTEPLYAAQKDFLTTLLINTDGTRESPSSRSIFLSKMRRYVIDLSMEQRVSVATDDFVGNL